jgi:hypothetical protein
MTVPTEMRKTGLRGESQEHLSEGAVMLAYRSMVIAELRV